MKEIRVKPIYVFHFNNACFVRKYKRFYQAKQALLKRKIKNLAIC